MRTPPITMKYYAHAIPEDDETAADAWVELMPAFGSLRTTYAREASEATAK